MTSLCGSTADAVKKCHDYTITEHIVLLNITYLTVMYPLSRIATSVRTVVQPFALYSVLVFVAFDQWAIISYSLQFEPLALPHGVEADPSSDWTARIHVLSPA